MKSEMTLISRKWNDDLKEKTSATYKILVSELIFEVGIS